MPLFTNGRRSARIKLASTSRPGRLKSNCLTFHRRSKEVGLKRLDWFVNREKQYLGFQKMLARQTAKTTMCIEAPGDMGKTWLIQRMRYHCEEHDVPAMHVDFGNRHGAYDYLSLVRLARDQIGPADFNSLTETINNFTGVTINLAGQGSGRVNVSDISQGSAVEVGGDLAGRDIIKDNQFYINADSEIARRTAEIQINDAFFNCLQALALQTPVVFLFDSYEEITPEADRWLQGNLLVRLRESLLDGVLVIIAGRRTPELDPTWRSLVAKTGLELFSAEHVREYIVERRQIVGLDLDTIFRTSRGNPGLLAKMADLAAITVETDDEWL